MGGCPLLSQQGQCCPDHAQAEAQLCPPPRGQPQGIQSEARHRCPTQGCGPLPSQSNPFALLAVLGLQPPLPLLPWKLPVFMEQPTPSDWAVYSPMPPPPGRPPHLLTMP